MHIDSGVCPGVARTSKVTSPSEIRWPSFKRLDLKFDVGIFAVANPRPGGSRQLQMTGQEVGVDVRFDDPLDLQAMFGSLAQVLVDIAARVDDHRTTGALIPDQIRPLRQTVQVVLRENHLFPLPRSPNHR